MFKSLSSFMMLVVPISNVIPIGCEEPSINEPKTLANFTPFIDFSYLYYMIGLICIIGAYRLFTRGGQQVVPCSSKALIISGCDSGIGLEIAKHYIKSGFTVVCGFLQPGKSEGSLELKNLIDSQDSLKSRVHLVKLDITNSGDIKDLIEFIAILEKENIKVWSLINNAGILIFGEFDWLTSEQCDQQILVNTQGTIQLTKALLPFIISCKGRVIHVTSVGDCLGFPGISVYSGSKSAIRCFSKMLGYELRKFGSHSVALRLGDFGCLTKIMSRHTVNADQMYANMDEAKRRLYGDYFHKFNDHIKQYFAMVSPSSNKLSILFRDIDKAVLRVSPPASIVCDTLGFRIFYFIVDLLPINGQYLLLDLMLKTMFKWTSPDLGEKS